MIILQTTKVKKVLMRPMRMTRTTIRKRTTKKTRKGGRTRTLDGKWLQSALKFGSSESLQIFLRDGPLTSSVACVIVGDLKIKRSCTISTKRNITGSVKAKGKARSSATSLFGHGVVPSIDGITFNIGSMRLFVNRKRKRWAEECSSWQFGQEEEDCLVVSPGWRLTVSI